MLHIHIYIYILQMIYGYPHSKSQPAYPRIQQQIPNYVCMYIVYDNKYFKNLQGFVFLLIIDI